VITTYTELQEKIAAWLYRSDLTAVIPDFIALAEERMSREVRVRQMEVAMVATAITDNRIAAPDNTVGVKVLWLPDYPQTPLTSQSFESVLSKGAEGVPTCYAWQGDEFYFDGSGDVQGVLYQAIPALSDANTSNWMLTKNPSAYLFGALYEAAIYTKDAEAEARFGGRFAAAIEAINGGDKRDTLGGALVARAR